MACIFYDMPYVFCLSRVIVVRIEFLAEKIWQLK